MNQILETKNKTEKVRLRKIQNILKIQLYISVFFIIIIASFIFYNKLKINKKEQYSSQVLSNYNITQLYDQNFQSQHKSNDEQSTDIPYVIGIIQIPKINIYYPIFSTCSDELLKISPCRFYGPEPGKTGNLCIAGHNYDNDKFFSKISSLKIDDEIILYNDSNKSFSYYVFDIYEVKPDDLSPIYSNSGNSSKELTLITCNNFNKNRIIVKAKWVKGDSPF